MLAAASAEYQVKLRLSSEQMAEKRAAEDELKEVQRQLDEEEDEERKNELKVRAFFSRNKKHIVRCPAFTCCAVSCFQQATLRCRRDADPQPLLPF